MVEWESTAKQKGFDSPKAMLTKLYSKDGYTMQDIASLIGCSSWSIGRALDKYEIPRRAHGGVRRSKGKPSIAAIEMVLQKLQKEEGK